MISRSDSTKRKGGATAPPVAEQSAEAALSALDAAIEEVAPIEEVPETEELSLVSEDSTAPLPKKRGRPRSKRVAKEEVKEPPTPALVDAYGQAAGGICRVGFRLVGRMAGGAPEVWELTDRETADLARSFGPLLAIHHDTIGTAMPYIEPALLLYQMYSSRAEIAAQQVAELRRSQGGGGTE